MLARVLTLAALLATTAAAANVARADDVYWTSKTLLADFFKTSDHVSYVKIETPEQRAELRALLGYEPAKKSYPVFVAKTGDHLDGYAVIDEELGQHMPITFGVKISPNGTVERVEVMVYREAYGSEVKEARFRAQYTGKSAADAARFREDVVAISGATISSKAMSAGIARALALVSIVKTRALAAL